MINQTYSTPMFRYDHHLLHLIVKVINQTYFIPIFRNDNQMHLIDVSSKIDLLLQCCEQTLKSWAVVTTFLHSHEMSLLSRFFYKRPPDGLLEFIDRIYGMHREFSYIDHFLDRFIIYDCFNWSYLLALYSFWFMLQHWSFASGNVSSLFKWDSHGVAWGTCRILIPGD